MSQCTNCKRRESSKPDSQTMPVGRVGGGNYARGGRSYHGRLCVRCAQEILLFAAQQIAADRNCTKVYGYEVSRVERALAEHRKRARR